MGKNKREETGTLIAHRMVGNFELKLQIVNGP